LNSRTVTDKIESSDGEFNALTAAAARIRGRIIQLSHQARTPHLGSSLSFVELLVYLYWHFLEISPENPKDAARDRFVLSKGHGITTLYAVLAERGFFPSKLFDDYAQTGSPLPEHPSPRCVPGIEAATGSLGHGLSVATGMALASKMNAIPYRVVSLLSDGECNEGSTWEAALLAPAHNLDNLIAIVDFNKWQATGRSVEITALEPLDQKFESFGWNSVRIDGHDFRQIRSALATAKKSDKPFAIIADTVKGKGIKMMEDDNNWHYRIPSKEEVDSAFEELGIDPY
jgi:transketolase